MSGDGIRFDVKLDTHVLDQMLAEVGGNRERVLDNTVAEIGATALRSMQAPKHGRMYGTHQASAPGEAPAIDTGELRDSWFVQKSKGRRVFGYQAPHGPHLEFGTVHMAARPFFMPALVTGSAGLIRKITSLAARGAVLAMWQQGEGA